MILHRNSIPTGVKEQSGAGTGAQPTTVSNYGQNLTVFLRILCYLNCPRTCPICTR